MLMTLLLMVMGCVAVAPPRHRPHIELPQPCWDPLHGIRNLCIEPLPTRPLPTRLLLRKILNGTSEVLVTIGGEAVSFGMTLTSGPGRALLLGRDLSHTVASVAVGGYADKLGVARGDRLHLINMVTLDDQSHGDVIQTFIDLPTSRPVELILERARPGKKGGVMFLHAGALLQDISVGSKPGPDSSIQHENVFSFQKTAIFEFDDQGKPSIQDNGIAKPVNEYVWPAMEIRMRSFDNHQLYVCHEGTDLKTCVNPPTWSQTIQRQFIMTLNPVKIRVMFGVNVGPARYYFKSNDDVVTLVQGNDQQVATRFKVHHIITSQQVYLFEETTAPLPIIMSNPSMRYRRSLRLRALSRDIVLENNDDDPTSFRELQVLRSASGRFLRADNTRRRLLLHTPPESDPNTISSIRLQVFLAVNRGLPLS